MDEEYNINARKLIENIVKKEKRLYVMFNYDIKEESLKEILKSKAYEFFSCNDDSLFNGDITKKIKSPKSVLVFTKFRKNNIKNIPKELEKISEIVSNEIILCINDNIEDEKFELKSEYQDLEKYTRINLKYVSKYNAHIITANFEEYKFDVMQSQLSKYGHVVWLNTNIIYEAEDSTEIKSKRLTHRFNINDDVYVYYTHLPLNKCAVLLKFRVKNNGYYNSEYEKEKCFFNGNLTKEGKLEKKIKLTREFNVTKEGLYAIQLELVNSLRSDLPFTYFDFKKISDLIEKDSDKEGTTNKLHGKLGINKKVSDDKKPKNKLRGKLGINKKASEDLNKYFTGRITDFKVLKELTKYFGEKCALENCEELNKRNYNHTTFYRANGLKYYELHHLVRQNNNELKDIIDQKFNIFPLCANCHRRIHSGEKKDREIMIEALYKQKEKEYKESFKKSYPRYNKKELEIIKEQYL